MNSHWARKRGDSQNGFTLVELVIVIAVLGVVAAVFVMNGPTPAAMTLPSQAQTLASDLRRAQTLAYTAGSRVRVTATPSGNTYSVHSCTSVSTCNTLVFSVALQNQVTFSAGSTATLDFDTLGQPSASASYTLVSGGDSKAVSVAALTGFVANP